jgi:hypothetical protein
MKNLKEESTIISEEHEMREYIKPLQEMLELRKKDLEKERGEKRLVLSSKFRIIREVNDIKY